MSLTKVVLAVVFALLSVAGAQSRAPGERPVSLRRLQNPAPISDCPVVEVVCPDVLRPGEPMTFVANISGGDPTVTPTFKWNVSGGKITSGQDTSSITVDVSEAAGKSITATVEVGGYHPACTMSDSCTLFPGLPPTARKVDEYGNIPFKNEKPRLDILAVELRNDPTAQGYFICYGGRRAGPGEARRRCERARSHLISAHGVDPTRVVYIDGGYREVPTVEFWIVPPGAAQPKPTPTFFPNELKPPTPPRQHVQPRR